VSARFPLVAVYADESCLGNGQRDDAPGGAAGLVEFRTRSGEIIRRDFWVSAPSTTNNRMALQSVITAFTQLSAKGEQLSVVFTTDSRYLVDGMTSWVHNWVRRGWRKADKTPVENVELWRDALSSVARGGHEVSWRWVRGHAGHPQNEWANLIAIRAAKEQSASPGLVASEYEAWAIERYGPELRGAEPFPTPDSFTAARSLPAA
jgi:ribonuclease HI